MYERYLYKCLAPIPFRKYKKRCQYLKFAIPRGLRKKILFFKKVPVGQIEYAPAEASGCPIQDRNVIVMNCIWVLRKAKGYRFGKYLLNEMIRDYEDADGFATIGLENHWSGWLRKKHMEYLGFKSIDSFTGSHKTKHTSERFKIHLMWLPNKSDRPPTWKKSKLLRGIDFCMAHPLYHPQSIKIEEILQQIP